MDGSQDFLWLVPDASGYTADLKEIESDKSDDVESHIQLNKDEKLYVMDWGAYIQEGQLIHWLNKVSTKDKSMEMVNEYIREYKDVFSATEFDQLP